MGLDFKQLCRKTLEEHRLFTAGFSRVRCREEDHATGSNGLLFFLLPNHRAEATV